jgi:DNA-directed RNA polymerase II subunit RPB1
MPAGFYAPSSEIEPVVGIQICVFSPDEIERRSVVEVTNSGTYEGNEPKIGGLFDPRMGVLDNGKECRSCGQTNHKCPGHFGHFRLARPVYYIQFLPFIQNILSCVCIRCSKLLVDKKFRKHFLKRKGEARWRDVLTASKEIKRCGQETEDGCGARQPTRYTREGIARIVAEWDSADFTPTAADAAKGGSDKQRQPLEVEFVLRLFRRILDEDVDFMGFSRYWCRPDWMICTVLPIPPPQVRPSVIQDNNQRSEDDLTHKLAEIIKTNNTYLQPRIQANAAKSVIDEWTNVLQYHIATLVDNQIPGVAPSAQRNGRPLKSIQQRLGSKEGRIRYNIQGKRVEFSARSVITPDPNISIAELGVPEKIAMNLTRPERVTEFNRDRLYKFIQNGPSVFPGAKTIRRGVDGRIISLRHVNTKDVVLHYGDIVNRHLMDGDIVLFNRQPTLHRMSMMAHKVKVLKYKTFRLNVSVTAPYNADFDGDEMNMHCPQSYEAATELEEIAAVPHQILRPRDGLPIIGVVQDTLVGSYRLTRDHVAFNRREFMNLMMWNKRFNGSIPEPRAGSKWSGHQILTQLMPPINMEMMNSSKKKVVIREGDVLEGQFDKSVFSKASKGIIHMTYNDYGSKETVDLLDAMQSTIEQFLIYNGFSVGISDLIADSATKDEMNVKIEEKKSEVESILLNIHQDLFDNNTGKTNQAEFEDKIFGILNKATELSGEIGYNSLANENRMTAMVRAGSKGGPINIAQMIACVGQQNIEGKRIPYGFEDRTLPHFKKYDDGAEARGFIQNSFINGLTPTEFFFHAMSGREGLIDTAVKTADTGYIQRQLVKAMEDLVVQHDGSVRDANMNIAQFHYGEDGINSTKIENQSLDLAKLSREDIARDFGLEGVDLTAVLVEGMDRGDDKAALKAYAEQIRQDQVMIVEGVFRSGSQGSVYSAVNLDRLILNIKIKFGLNDKVKTNLTPTRVLAGIEAVLDKTQRFHKTWAALLRYSMSPMKMIVRDRFTESAFDVLCEMLVTKNWQAWVQPGEQVGIIAAQSIGEPSTQMTLNSVDWDTKVMIAKNGEIVCPQIGEFIDAHMAANPEKIQTFPNNQLYMTLDDGNDWKAISCDENGKQMWTKLEAITRHPVINEDGTNTILEVELDSGRTVKATKGKSFLTLIDGKVLDINGSELKVGDILPIANSLALNDLGIKETVSVRSVLPATEWMYGTDVSKALAAIESGDRHWFQKNQGTLFTLPYSRSDAFREAIVDGKNTNAEQIQPGFVYPARTRPDVSQIPEEIPLTQNFGYFVGAYLAEGMANTTQVNITNNDTAYLERVNALMSEWNVGTHMVSEQREAEKTGIKGTSTSLVIHSTVLATVMQALFGRVSHEKTLPDWVFQAPDAFVHALVDAYISGDGSVCKKSGTVHATSVSKELLVRFSTLLVRYGIFSTISQNMSDIGKFDSVRMNYTLHIPAHYSKVFAETFSLSIGYKQDILDYHFGLMEKGKQIRRQTTGDIIWDTIKSIKEVVPIKERVYDFTVETTRNFMTYSCLAVKDTFHLAGVASKSNVTRGVPRLKELLKVTQNPKAISLTIPLKKEYRNSKAKAREVSQELELTLLRDMTLKTAIYFDPKDSETVLKEDRELLAFFRMFEVVEEPQAQADAWSKYILRLELNRQAMFDKNITMDDILFVLRRRFEDEVQMVYSDFNSQKLVMRIRLSKESLATSHSDPSSLDALSSYKKFQNKLLNAVIIRGLPGIKAATFRKGSERLRYVEESGKYETSEEYILDTDGSNFLEVMNHPAVDATRVTSTHVHDIYSVLGIEATRHILYTEITTLFEDGQINYRHLGLLVDVMTRAGRLMSVDRYGINKLDIGPLAKARFEETERILLKAAVFCEIDPITGVSANIMTGQPIRGGTAFSDILLDEGAVIRLQKGLPPVTDYRAGREAPLTPADEAEEESTNDNCSPSRLRMNLTLPTTKTRIMDEPDIEFVELEDDE